MKKITLVMTILAFLALSVSCTSDRNEGNDSMQKAEQNMEEAGDEMEDSAEAAGDEMEDAVD